MTNTFLGQIMMFGGNFAPRNYAFCNGQLMSIAQNSALFSLLGTTYGGDGIQTFALPNLQSQLAIHQGHGPGLSNYVLGQKAGTPNVTLLTGNMPAHSHSLNATKTNASSATITNSVLPGVPTTGSPPEFYAAQIQGQPALIQHPLVAGSVGPNGGNQPHINLMPSLCISFCIALAGIFPSRN